MIFQKCGDQLTKEDISAFEKSFKISLPDSFISHYLKYNGGIPSTACFYMEAFDVTVEISRMLPIKYSNPPSQSLENLYKDFVYDKQIFPKNFLPFARDWGGNLYFSETSPLFSR